MIEVHDLHKRLGPQEVLRGINMIVGRAKTSVGRTIRLWEKRLLKHLIGLMQPTSGTVIIDGQPISDLPERKLLEVRRQGRGASFRARALRLDDGGAEPRLSSAGARHQGRQTLSANA
jgi:ABC-type transporter Mla maintaining outer membrane lipid asymmetry ATPase subunit MlaF